MNNLTYLSNGMSQELKRQLARNCRREIAIIKYYPWQSRTQQLADVKRADRKKNFFCPSHSTIASFILRLAGASFQTIYRMIYRAQR